MHCQNKNQIFARIDEIRDRLYILDMLSNKGKWSIIKERKTEMNELIKELQTLEQINK